MFKLLIVALAALQLVACVKEGEPCNPGERSVHIEGTCSTYLFCGNRVWTRMACHAGYRLDLNTMYCSIVDDSCLPCYASYIKSREFKTVSGDCGKYYECNPMGDMEIKSCPTGLFYNTATRACDAPENVTCA
jgi:hypothetical protein